MVLLANILDPQSNVLRSFRSSARQLGGRQFRLRQLAVIAEGKVELRDRAAPGSLSILPPFVLQQVPACEVAIWIVRPRAVENDFLLGIHIDHVWGAATGTVDRHDRRMTSGGII